MKYKQIALVLGLAVTTVFYSGCSGSSANAASQSEAGTEESADSKESESENVIYGEVSSIEDNKLVINVGTRKEMEKPDGESSGIDDSEKDDSEKDDSGTDNPSEKPDGGDFSLLDLTGETQEIEITDSTTLEKGGMGAMMGGGQGGRPSGEAPADGEAPSGEAPADGEAPAGGEAPSGEAPAGGDQMENTTEEITIDDIAVGDTVAITLDEDGNATKITVVTMNGGGQNGGQMGQPSASVESYDAAVDYTEDTQVEDESFVSTGTDENAIHVSEGANVTLDNAEISRESSDSTGGDNASFYGVGAALLNTDGTTYINNSIINTDSAGGAGIFAYGDGIVYAANTTITTTQDTSGGIHAAGGGTLYAWDLTAETNGTSSAAVRSDRGGGTMVIDGGIYTSNGADSPAVYSTADIAINNATLTANGAEAVCIEGLNSLRLYDCDLSGSLTEDERNDCVWNVILYQSMSGDSEVGNSTFEMNGGTLSAREGGMFYTTNTESTITLSNVEITSPENNSFFLKCTGNQNERGWGNAGDNGADCLFTADTQKMEGDVIWDSISQLDFYMTNNSLLSGAFVNDETSAGEGGDGYCNLFIDETSEWTVTGDSTLSSLGCAGTIQDEEGNTVTVTGADGTTYVEGDSEYTITVDSYQDSADTGNASSATKWDACEVEKPSELN